ncbi:MAG: hypothetical protein Q8M03_01725 [Legionella sp.]|nr:hypothetical protein [Legionella sp.]
MSKYKPVISPGQGLLLLLDHYKENTAKALQLKKLYLSGAETPDKESAIRRLLQDPVLDSYQVSFDAATINNDPTRRYFETHLSYESLTHGLSEINLCDLEQHVERLHSMVPDDKKGSIAHVLNGDFEKTDKDLFKEYGDYINKINSGKMFPNLSTDDKRKLELLVKSSFLGVINAWYTPMPLNIYGTGIYSESNKGKVMTADQETTRNQNLGLLKGHMPIALNDIARSETEIPYLKPSDQASFVKHAKWVESNFGKMVHPFSNSISGTMLCQLRAHAKLQKEGQGVFTDSASKMAQFSQLLTSAMLFNSGGHTLNEFTAPLTLSSVRSEFQNIPQFNSINLESIYLTGNQTAFDAALDDSIQYNKTLLLRQNLHAQIKNKNPVDLQKLREVQELNKLDDYILKVKDRITKLQYGYNQDIKNQFLSPLRAGIQKNVLIQYGLKQVISCMERGDLTHAQTIINVLRNTLESKYGKNNFWGELSESYKIVESVDKELQGVKNMTLSYKDRIQELRTSIDTSSILDSSKEEAVISKLRL